MDSATWCRTPAAASAAKRLRPEVSKNFSTALSSNEGELVRSITTCAPATASLRPSPVMLLTPVLGEAATTSWPPWRRMATVFEPIKPVPPMTTIFMAYPPLRGFTRDRRFIAPSRRMKCHVEPIPAVDRDDRQTELRQLGVAELLACRIVDCIRDLLILEAGYCFRPCQSRALTVIVKMRRLAPCAGHV